MKVGHDSTAHLQPVNYTECMWGDLIQGTKEQLQDLGLGIGLAFPGEPGGPKRQLNLQDGMGFPVRISNISESAGRFYAHREFPHWPKDPSWHYPSVPYSPGVEVRSYPWRDEYVGAAGDLADAGIVRLEQFPGQPGMRKTHVTIYADGTAAMGPKAAEYPRSREAGARTVVKASKSTYRIAVIVSETEVERRREAEDAAKKEWQALIRSLPRPRRLMLLCTDVDTATSRERRAIVDFLLTPNVTKDRRSHLDPRAPQRSQEIQGRERLSLCYTDLEGLDGPMWGPIHHARVAIAAKMQKRPDELHHSAKLYRAIDDLGYALAVHTSADDRRRLGGVIVRLRELTGWTEND